ncbi:MAG: menaquinone biosynthesis protein [Dissulfuribacterales bacterium]
MSKKQILKVGIVNFINTSGIYVPWQDMESERRNAVAPWQVIEGPPSLLNRLLKANEIDVGLISSYAYGLDIQNYFMLPNLGISAVGAVGSVFLITRKAYGLHEMADKRILLTSQSATSVNLLRLILERFYQVIPRYECGNFTDFEADIGFDGYLAIGDEALQLKKHRPDLYFFDLAEIWMEKTGLPFVFAVWAVRSNTWERMPDAVRALHHHILTCYRNGLRELEQISARVASRAELTARECLNYLRGIHLHFDSAHMQALTGFFQLLHESFDYPFVPDLHIIQI